jgi:cyclin-dependent kinase regulatory subunit CKS1
MESSGSVKSKALCRNECEYSDIYQDDTYEYRHVIVTKDIVYRVRNRYPNLLTEQEWRGYGVKQSLGWVHYAYFAPEMHVLLFRRSLDSPYASSKKLNVIAPITNKESKTAVKTEPPPMEEKQQAPPNKKQKPPIKAKVVQEKKPKKRIFNFMNKKKK